MRSSTTLAVLALATTSFGLSGEATFYDGNLSGGTCSFSTYTLPAGIYGTALSDSNWDDAAHCGACIEVTGPSGTTITAMIVDQCPDCGINHLDLFPDAFAELADPVKGVIDTTWSYVECPITTPIEVHNKEGVSEYWFSMQVVNANKEVSTLEVSIDEGTTWQGTDRQTYNFFEKSNGFGTSSVTVKVTSIDGDIVIVAPVAVSPNEVIKADINFISEVGPGSSSSSVPAAVPAAVPAVATTPSPAPSVETPVVPTSTVAADKPATTVAPPAMQDSPSPAVGATEPEAPAPSTASHVTSPAAPKKTSPAPAPEVMVQKESSTPTTPASTHAAIPAADLNATPSAVIKASPAATPATTPAAEVEASSSAEAMPTSPAAYSASPEAESTSIEGTSTSSSTLTIIQTITLPRPSATPSKYTPSAKPYPTTLMSAEPTITTTIYACESSSPAAGVASSTLQIVVSPVPTTASTSPSTTLIPFTGAASTNAAPIAFTLLTIIIAALL